MRPCDVVIQHAADTSGAGAYAFRTEERAATQEYSYMRIPSMELESCLGHKERHAYTRSVAAWTNRFEEGAYASRLQHLAGMHENSAMLVEGRLQRQHSRWHESDHDFDLLAKLQDANVTCSGSRVSSPGAACRVDHTPAHSCPIAHAGEAELQELLAVGSTNLESEGKPRPSGRWRTAAASSTVLPPAPSFVDRDVCASMLGASNAHTHAHGGPTWDCRGRASSWPASPLHAPQPATLPKSAVWTLQQNTGNSERSYCTSTLTSPRFHNVSEEYMGRARGAPTTRARGAGAMQRSSVATDAHVHAPHNNWDSSAEVLQPETGHHELLYPSHPSWPALRPKLNMSGFTDDEVRGVFQELSFGHGHHASAQIARPHKRPTPTLDALPTRAASLRRTATPKSANAATTAFELSVAPMPVDASLTWSRATTAEASGPQTPRVAQSALHGSRTASGFLSLSTQGCQTAATAATEATQGQRQQQSELRHTLRPAANGSASQSFEGGDAAAKAGYARQQSCQEELSPEARVRRRRMANRESSRRIRMRKQEEAVAALQEIAALREDLLQCRKYLAFERSRVEELTATVHELRNGGSQGNLQS